MILRMSPLMRLSACLLLACSRRSAAEEEGKAWCEPIPGRCFGKLQQLQELPMSADHPFANISCGTWGSGTTTKGLQVVDWDGDGALDLLLAQTVQGVYEVKLFQQPTAPAGGDAPLRFAGDIVSFQNTFGDVQLSSAFAATDWDGDGDVDLLLVDLLGVHFFERVSKSTFAVVGRGLIVPWASLPEERIEADDSRLGFYSAFKAIAVDWDNDGDQDLFLMSTRCKAPLYFQRMPDGSLNLTRDCESPFWGMDLVSSSGEIIAGDWDADGDVDLTILDSWSCGRSVVTGSPRYFERTADGSLTEHAGEANPFHLRYSIVYLEHIVWVDWNRDGILDILGCADGQVHLHQRKAEIQYQERAGALSPFSRLTEKRMAPAIVDWNGDGLQDLLLGQYSDGPLRFFQRAADGTLPSEGEVLLEEELSTICPYGPLSPKPVDWDGDGDLDLWILAGSDKRALLGTLHYFERLDNGTFAERSGVAITFKGFGSVPLSSLLVTSFEVVDWDNDGDVDLIVRRDPEHWSPDGALLYFQRLPDDTLLEEEGVFQHINVSALVDISAIDWNGDGRADLVLGGYHGIRYFERQAGGNFTLHERAGDANPFRGLGTGFYPHQDIADWDGDGVPDVVFSTGVSDSLGGLQLWQRGFCEVQESCSSRGACNPTRGTCDCLSGHAFSDCSACASGYSLSRPSNVYCPSCSQFRTCSACPGMKPFGQVCSLRGDCQDDFFERNLTLFSEPFSLSSLNISSRHGDGTCLCRPPFHGQSCEEGQCPAGLEYHDHAFRNCQPCKPGFHKSGAGNTLCNPCSGNRYAASAGQSDCEICQSRWSHMQVNGENTSCNFDPLAFVVIPVMLLLSAAFVALLPLLLGISVGIQDVRWEQPGVLITTRGKHFLLGASRGVRATFRGTGHPVLDSSDRELGYRVRVLNDTQLLLLGADNRSPIHAEIDSSMGSLHFARRDALKTRGVFGMHFGCWMLLLLVCMGIMFVLANQTEDRFRLTLVETVQIPIGMVIASLLHFWREHRVQETQLDLDVKSFKDDLRSKNPDPQECPKGPLRAISAAQLLSFSDKFESHIGSRNMYYICSNIVKPLTEEKKLSYAELSGPSRLQWFCSHFWGTAFKHFVDTIHQHALAVANGPLDDLSYWICTFANNQWKVEEELGADWRESSFYLALRSGYCEGTAIVLDENVKPLTRSWCLFELLHTTILSREQREGKFMRKGSQVFFNGLYLCTRTGVMNLGQSSMDLAYSVSEKLANLSLRDASSSVQRDKEMIDDLVVREIPGGFEQVNKDLIEVLKGALGETKTRFFQKIGRLEQQLDRVSLESTYCAPSEGCGQT